MAEVASLVASIIIDKNNVSVQALKAISSAQRDLENNKLEIFFDLSDASLAKELNKVQKKLSTTDYKIKVVADGKEQFAKDLKEFQKIIKDFASGKGINTGIGKSLIDEKQLKSTIELFSNIEKHLSDIKKVISDVGDGNELSPLLTTIKQVSDSISQLSTKTQNLGFNMNIDVGTDGDLDRKLQAKIASALQSYQNLFNHIKMSGAAGSLTDKFFDFDINQYDNSMQKLQAYIDFIKNARKEAKSLYGGHDIIREGTDKSYWTQASSALAQITKVQNEIKKSTNGGTEAVSDIFGKTDLSEVIGQLSTIVSKLGEISTAVSTLPDIFKNGLNVNTSVEEIINLTNKVKELETELANVRNNNLTSPQKTNISLGDSSAVDTQNKLQEELKETQVQAEKTAQAILKVTGYRGTNGGDPVTSNKSGATFWDSKKNVAKMYGTNSSDKTLWSSELSFNNPLTIDANKQKFGDITYLGKGADEASKRILELTQRENELRESLKKSTQSGEEQVKMALELSSVCKEIAKISNDASNPYGTHSTDWFAEYAKNNGYDGVAIKNVLDTPDSYAKNGTEASDVYITFQREQLQNTTLLAKANHELAESEREVALAELGIIQNQKKDAFQADDSDVSIVQKVADNFKEIKQNTDDATKATEKYQRVLSQVGELGVDTKVSAMYQRNDGQLESVSWRAKRNDQGQILYDKDGNIDYDFNSTVISKYEQLEKIVIKADNELRDLQKTLSDTQSLDPTASTANIEKQIQYQKDYIQLLEQTVKTISQQNEYLLYEQQIIDARNKAENEYNLKQGTKSDVSSAKASALENKKAQLEVDKQIAKEEENLAKAQQKKAQAFLKEQETYEKTQKETEALKRQSDIYDNLIYAIQRYSTLSKKIVNGKAIAEDVEDANFFKSIIDELKESPVLSEKQIKTASNKLVKLNDDLEDLRREKKKIAEDSSVADDKNKSEDIDYLTKLKNLLIEIRDLRKANESLNGSSFKDSEIDLNNSKIEKKQAEYNLILAEAKKSGTFDETAFNIEKDAINAETDAILNLTKARNQDKKAKDLSKADQKDVTDTDFIIKQTESLMSKFNAYKATNTKLFASSEPEAQKLVTQFDEMYNRLAMIRGQADRVKNGLADSFDGKSIREAKKDVQDLSGEFRNFSNDVKTAGYNSKTLGDTLKTTFKNLTQYFVGANALQNIERGFTEIYNAAKEYNESVVNLQIASGENEDYINSLMKTYNGMAKTLGATTKEVAESADSWLRQGYSLEDTNNLITASMVQSKVGQLDSAESTQYLTSALKGYKLEASDAMNVVDKMSAVDLQAAVSLGGLAEAMAETANSARTMGISMDQLLGYAAVVGETTQDSMSSVGNAFKRIFSRMGNVKAGKFISDDGEDLSDVEKVLKKFNIKLRDSKDEFRNFGDVIDEVASRWNTFTTVEQRAIVTAMAGATQSEKLLVLFENYPNALKYAETAANASGTAMEKFGAYEEGVEAKTKEVKAAFEGLSNSLLDSDAIKVVLEGLTKLIEALDFLVEKVGTLGSIGAIVSGVAGAKGYGLTYSYKSWLQTPYYA